MLEIMAAGCDLAENSVFHATGDPGLNQKEKRR